MSTIIVSKEVTVEEIRARTGRANMVFYGANTPWWTNNEDDLYRTRGPIAMGLPCDPRGGVLFQTAPGGLNGFLDAAEANPEFYGRHRLRAFLAAYHGVVIVQETGLPTCLDTWADYNRLLDAQDRGEALVLRS